MKIKTRTRARRDYFTGPARARTDDLLPRVHRAGQAPWYVYPEHEATRAPRRPPGGVELADHRPARAFLPAVTLTVSGGAQGRIAAITADGGTALRPQMEFARQPAPRDRACGTLPGLHRRDASDKPGAVAPAAKREDGMQDAAAGGATRGHGNH